MAGARPLSLVRYTFNFEPMRALSAKIAGQGRQSSDAIRKAHKDIAVQLQLAIAQELQSAIETRGSRGIAARHQRPTNALLRAITSEKNRRVNLGGFVVGFLDDYYENDVNRYYRNLEVGSSVFVGRTIHGVFLSSSGQTRPPTSDESRQVDPRLLPMKTRSGNAAGATSYRMAFVNGGRSKVFVPAIVIRNPIPAYHYFQKAERSFIEQEVTLDTTLYEEAFASYGLNFFAMWMRAHGSAPSLKGSSLHFTRGSAREVEALGRQRRALES